MKTVETRNGTLIIGSREEIFEVKAEQIRAAATTTERDFAAIGLTGGSTPKAWYPWAVEKGVFSKEDLAKIVWLTSDERTVPMTHADNNFGHAARGMLDPLGVRHTHRLPFASDMPPSDGAVKFNADFKRVFGEGSFDICILGMGDDCHCASIFPGSDLIGKGDTLAELATADNVPSRGWRLTATEWGIGQSRAILQIGTGANKAEALKTVLEGELDPKQYPSQMLAQWSEKVTIIADEAACSALSI